MINNNNNNILCIIANIGVYNYQRTNNNITDKDLNNICKQCVNVKGVHLLNGITENEPVPKIKLDQAFIIKNAYVKGSIIYADIHVLDNEKGKIFLNDYNTYNIGFDIKILVMGGQVAPLYCLSSLSNKFN